MDIALSYLGESGVRLDGELADVRFAPNLRRRPVYFEGGLRDPLLFRDSLLNLHDVVVSDFDTRLTAADIDAILDPVVTAARDEIFFEAFSQDESSYGRVALKAEMIGAFEEWQGGTTNVDFTPALAQAIGAIRSTSRAALRVEKEGFAVRTEAGNTREKKVQVPASWLRGFLNVQAAMSFPAHTFELGRADLRNLLAFMRTHKEREGPRALVLRLTPGQPVQAVFEPWNHVMPLTQSIYHGDEEVEVRLWGRRRLSLLNRMIPKIRRVTAYLLGSGYPSFWLCDLGAVSFTLGISGWTVRPFASSGLSLATPRATVDASTLADVLRTVQAGEQVSAAALGRALGLSPATTGTALALLCEQGKVMFDLEAGSYRWRELLDTPLDDLRTETDHRREAAGQELVRTGRVHIDRETVSGVLRAYSGTVRGENSTYPVSITLDAEGRMVDGDCGCTWFQYNHLRAGPCKHLIGLAQQVLQDGG
ncbi:MAG TPA: SWIM zinc finger family protein [Abditibacteriaceae bacterium]|nr:SWIM zinc finger family protein [Abditibacteriaceae bacterium]